MPKWLDRILYYIGVTVMVTIFLPFTCIAGIALAIILLVLMMLFGIKVKCDSNGFTCFLLSHEWITWYDIDGMKKHCTRCDKIKPHNKD